MKFTLKSLINRPDLPIWFTGLNYLAFLGFIFWPFTAFSSIFLFDNPSSVTEATYVLFILSLIYPFILLSIMLLSFWLFKYQKSNSNYFTFRCIGFLLLHLFQIL